MKFKITDDNWGIISGINGPGPAATASDCSYLKLRGITETLRIPPHIIRNINVSHFKDESRPFRRTVLIGILNMALKESQYIEFEPIKYDIQNSKSHPPAQCN